MVFETNMLRRRSPRIVAELPITIDFAGETAEGRTGMLSRHGALIVCGLNLGDGDRVMVTNRTSGESARCHVVWCGGIVDSGARKYGVEMNEPLPVFWGIDFARLGREEPVV